MPGYSWDPYWLGIGGICFDENGNLWVTNSDVDSALHVREIDGTWQSFDFGTLVNSAQTGSIIIDSYNQKWIIIYIS